MKEDIYRQGGAAWMVGKANVGKSALFEVVFPKGRGQKRVNAENLKMEETVKPFTSNAAAMDDNEVDPFENEPSLTVQKNADSKPELDAFDQAEVDAQEETAKEEQDKDEDEEEEGPVKAW